MVNDSLLATAWKFMLQDFVDISAWGLIQPILLPWNWISQKHKKEICFILM